MNKLVAIIILSIVSIFGLVETTPAALCLSNYCSMDRSGNSKCFAYVKVRIGGYTGDITIPSAQLSQENCSNDGVFCVRMTPDIYFTYGHTVRLITGPIRFSTAANNICIPHAIGASEYYFDV